MAREPDQVLVEFAGVGHALPLERTEQFNVEIARFAGLRLRTRKPAGGAGPVRSAGTARSRPG